MNITREWLRRCFDNDPTLWSCSAVILGMLLFGIVISLGIWGVIALLNWAGFWGQWMGAALLVGALLLLFAVAVVRTWEDGEPREE